MNTSTIFYIVGGLVGLVIGLLASLSSIKKIIRIHRTPTSNISALPSEGRQVEVVGKATGKTITSPLTQTACVFWQAEVILRTGGKTTYSIYKDASKEPFNIKDGTSEVQIVPDGADLTLLQFQGYSNYQIPHNMDQKMIDTIKSLNPNKEVKKGSYLDAFEIIIKPEDQIYVLGTLKSNNGTKQLGAQGKNLFIIAYRSERETLNTMYWKVVGNCFVWIFATVLAAYLLPQFVR